MLDSDLSDLYGVATKVLNRAVQRNRERFPADFMFPLTPAEVEDLRRQIGTSSWGGRRYVPNVFTQPGVAMLSSVVNSQRAILVNVVIMRTFVKLKEVVPAYQHLLRKVDAMEKNYDARFKQVFRQIRRMMAPPAQSRPPRSLMGFAPPSGPAEPKS